MRRTDILRTTAFRWTLGIAGIVAVSISLIAGFFYWQTVGYLTMSIDRTLAADLQFFSLAQPADRVSRIDESLSSDNRRRKAFGLFGPDGKALAGNLPTLPSPLPAPGRVEQLEVLVAPEGSPPRMLTVLAVAERLETGDILFVGRVAELLSEIKQIISRALALAIAPTLAVALTGGILVSTGTLRRVEAVRRACLMIMEGHLDRRLPVRSKQDEFDRLSEIVNRMLDDIERLMVEAKGAGDAIAHDLRTPLTRIRARLERALVTGIDPARITPLLEKSIADIDQLLTTVTAILRIAEVEQSRRRSGFASIDLDDIVTAASELYAPIAEEKAIDFRVERRPVPPLSGDGDLMFEAIANLLDNAVKFTPAGGRVDLDVGDGPDGVRIIVRDNGPGIPVKDREAVLRRFYRADQSRGQPGTGLGLNLVVAIVRLHGFTLTLAETPGGGCEATIHCREPGGVAQSVATA